MITSRYLGLSSDKSITDLIIQSDQEVVFSKLLNTDVSGKFKNPYRDDRHGKCYLEYKKGILRMYDRADVMFMGLNVYELFTKIEGIVNQSEGRARFSAFLNSNHFILPSFLSTPTDYESFQFRLAWKDRDWTKADKMYWSTYGITKDFLESEDTFPVERYWFNTRTHPDVFKCIVPREITYRYIVNNRGKLYSPISKSFITNQLPTDIGGVSELDFNKPLFIANSFKDYASIAINGFNCRYILSESVGTPEGIIELSKSFPHTIILMDNDEAGLNAVMSAPRIPNITVTQCPVTKDPADIVRFFGKGVLKLKLNEYSKEFSSIMASSCSTSI